MLCSVSTYTKELPTLSAEDGSKVSSIVGLHWKGHTSVSGTVVVRSIATLLILVYGPREQCG